MSAEMYEAVAFALRYWFILVMAAIIAAVVYVSVTEYKKRKRVLAEVGRLIGYLEIVGGPEELIGERLGLENENSIGRSKRSGIQIDDPSILKSHALIYYKAGQTILSPLAANSVKLNGSRLSKARAIGEGDVITLGEVSMILHLKSEDVSGGEV